MAHYQIILAYDGTQFAGFQRLNSSGKVELARTVQGEFEKALAGLGWAGSSILSAGRTDRGVHASGQVVAFELEWRHSEQELCRALNARLPEDIVVQAVRVVPESFHPRYAAAARSYVYRIYCREQRDPLAERYAWKVWPVVDLSLLNEAAGLLKGKHDFKAFGSPPGRSRSTVRTVWQANWVQEDSPEYALRLRFEITGDAFLYHMVRHLVFTQVRIGQGNMEMSELVRALAQGDIQIHGLAPASGLFLKQVMYEP